MEKNKIEYWIGELDWQNEPTRIENAIQELSKIEEKDYPWLFFKMPKGSWDYCAEVIQRIGFPKMVPYIPLMFEWFQDLNWPGWEIISETLKVAPRNHLILDLESSLRKALDSHDDEWVGGLKMAIEKIGIIEGEFHSKYLYQSAMANDSY